MKIVFIGTCGSGKSVLATQVFASLKILGKRVEHIHEFIRHDINLNGPMTSVWEQYRTRQYQKELEDAVPDMVDYVICDSGTLTPFFYASLYLDPNQSRQRLVLQDMFKYITNDLFLKRYDIIFYVPYVPSPNLEDGTRYQTEEEVLLLDEHMRLFFTKIHKLSNVFTLQKEFDNRLEEAMKIILDHST